MRLKYLFTLALAFVALFSGGRAFGQFDTAALVGRVSDASGAMLPGAKVTAINVDTNVSISRVANKDGEFNIPALHAGNYRLTAEYDGFNEQVVEGIKLQIGTNQRVDIKMIPGTSESVTVDSNQLELETATSQKQQVLIGEQIEALPLQNMDYTDLLRLSAGVSQDAAGEDLGTSSVRREGAFVINGMRSTYNNYLLDGLDNNAHGTSNQGFSNQVIQPSQFNILQFSIGTTLPPAEFGRSAGGMISAAFKSGTNRWHASVYDSLRNTVLNANGYFRAFDAAGNPNKTTLISNQFGGNAGGPILRGKFFLFVDYEGFRQVKQTVNQANIFTVSTHQLIISPNATANTTTVLNPYTGATYAADRPLPRSALSPIALAILDSYPLPNNNGAGATSVSSNYSVLQRFTNSYDKEDARLDAQFSERMSGFVRVSQSKEHDLDGPTLPAPLATGNGYFRTINQQVALGLTRQIRKTELLEARLGVSYTKGGKMPTVLGDPGTFGVQGLPTDPRVWGGLTSIAISGYSAIGRQATNPQWQYPFFLNPKLTYSRQAGNHNFKVGYEFTYLRQTVQDVNPIYGQMNFNGSFTGYDISDFLFGAPNEIDLTNLFVAHIRQGGHSAFLQDDWRILPKLTLNLGVRYEYASHFYEKDSHLTNFDPVLTPQTGQLIRAKASGSAYDRQLIDPDLNDFMPRVGFAYAMNPRLVLHGGYGIGYVHYTRSGESDNLSVNAPQVNAAVYNQAPTYDKVAGVKATATFFTLDQGYPEGMSDPANFSLFTSQVNYIPRNYRDPYVQSCYFGFQTSLSKTMLFDLAYVGNHAIKLQEVGDYNQRRPELGLDPATGYFAHPYTNIGDVIETFNGGFSKYNGLQARYEVKNFHGLFLLNAFTWSRTFGNVVDPLTASHGFSGSPQDYDNLRGDYGPLQYDLPILNNTSLIWTLPLGRRGVLFKHVGHTMNQVLGGWQISFFNSYHSGPALTPNFSPTSLQYLSNSGGVQYRPYLALGVTPAQARQRLHIPNHPEEAFCDSVYASSTQSSFNGCKVMFSTTPPTPLATPTSNAADFSGTANDPRGNVPVGFLRGDTFDQLDAGVNKRFSLPWDNIKLDMRLQFFNVLNKTNFTVPGMSCCSTSFGRITSTYGPGRIGQIQARMLF